MLELANSATQGRLPNKQNFGSAAKTSLICCDDGASQVWKVENGYSALQFHFTKSPSVDNSKYA
jgi:hypothetical protein